MPSKKEPASLYEIKITLLELTPEIWRLVVIPRDITLGNLHHVIQIAMGWEDNHLHEFEIGRKRYGQMIAEEFGFEDATINEDIVHLNGVAKPKAKFMYTYDFGDGWQHEIHIEREVESGSDKRQASCIAGENACPPEDCGGPFGYPDMVAILSDPQHEEYEDMREWVGEDFDPLQFDLTAVNRRLAKCKV